MELYGLAEGTSSHDRNRKGKLEDYGHQVITRELIEQKDRRQFRSKSYI